MAIVRIQRKNRFSYKVVLRDLDGEYLPSRSFDTLKEAEGYEAGLINSRNKGTRAKSKKKRRITLADYWTEWSVECRLKASDGWKSSQDQMFRDHIEPVLGHYRLIDLSKADVAKLLSRAKAKGLGDQMRLHIFNLLHQMMSDAVEIYEYRDSNPVLKKFRPDMPKVERKFLKPAMAKAFLNFVADHWLGPAFWLMILNGLRSGEMQALRRKHIDLDAASVLLEEQWIRKEKRFGPLKNGMPVRLPMPKELVDYLRRKLPNDMDPEAFIVKNRKNAKHLDHGKLWKELRAACTDFGIEPISPHELRHTCSELWVENGASKEDLRRLFNHSSDASTEGYIHKTNERLTRISKKVAKAKRVSLTLVK